MEFDDIKNLWQHQAEQTLPPPENVLQKVKLHKQKILQNLLRTVIQLTATFAFILLLVLTIKFTSPVTYIGIVVMLLCMSIYAYITYQHYKLLSKDFSTLPANEYISTLKQTYITRQKFLQNGTLVYVLGLSFGLLLYLIEPISFLSPFWKIFAIVATIAWILFATLYLAKRSMKKEFDRFDEMIKHLNELNSRM